MKVKHLFFNSALKPWKSTYSSWARVQGCALFSLRQLYIVSPLNEGFMLHENMYRFCARVRCTRQTTNMQTPEVGAKLCSFQATFWQVLPAHPGVVSRRERSAGEQSCRKKALLLELLTDSSVSPPLSWAIQSMASSSATDIRRQTDKADGHTVQLLHTPCSNMFFAHLQQIKFPSKWISSLVAFGGRATLFSLIFILYPPNKWSTVQPAPCCCRRRVFDFPMLSLLSRFSRG